MKLRRAYMLCGPCNSVTLHSRSGDPTVNVHDRCLVCGKDSSTVERRGVIRMPRGVNITRAMRERIPG